MIAKRIVSNSEFTATNEDGFDRRKEIQTLTFSSLVMKTKKIIRAFQRYDYCSHALHRLQLKLFGIKRSECHDG